MTPSPRLLLTIDYDLVRPSRRYDFLPPKTPRLDDNFAREAIDRILEVIKM